MKKPSSFFSFLFSLVLIAILFGCKEGAKEEKISLNQSTYYEATGINYLVFSNWYNGNFSDSKMSLMTIQR